MGSVKFVRVGSGFDLAVVGESRYQDALESICGRRESSANLHYHARLIKEDDNPYDDQAVRVEIQKKLVGYLSREDARAYRLWAAREYPNTDIISCDANVRGGWDRGGGDRGNFGVWLAMPKGFKFGEASAPHGEGSRSMSRGQVVQCTECGAKTSARFTRCPGCGGALVPEGTPMGPISGPLIGTGRGVGEQQAPAQVQYVQQKPKRKIGVTVALILLGACVVCGVLGGGFLVLGGMGSMNQAGVSVRSTLPPSTPLPTSTSLPTSTPVPLAPPFTEIRDRVEGMTEAQWKAYLVSLKGLRVASWSGWVSDVDVSGSTYDLLVDMDPPDDILSDSDVVFEVAESKALGYQKGQSVRFSGTIERVFEFFGSVTVYLVDVDVSP